LNKKKKLLEDELKDSKVHLNKFSSDKLEKMLNGQKHNSDKFHLDADFSYAFTLHASNSKRNTLFNKPVKVEEVKASIASLYKRKNSYMNNYVKPKSKALSRKQTQAKFVLICHYYRIVCYVRPNCYQSKS
jgi:hypothetical protein